MRLRERGRELPAQIAELALELQARGCHNVNCVTPEHVVPQLVEAPALAIPRPAGARVSHRHARLQVPAGRDRAPAVQGQGFYVLGSNIGGDRFNDPNSEFSFSAPFTFGQPFALEVQPATRAGRRSRSTSRPTRASTGRSLCQSPAERLRSRPRCSHSPR